MTFLQHNAVIKECSPFIMSAGATRVLLNRQGTTSCTFQKTEVKIGVSEETAQSYVHERVVIDAPHGAKVLPYFKRGDQWQVVMVEQFRIALPGKTIEPAGGEADESDILVCMARELKEETRIVVQPQDIQLAFAAYIQPSIMRSRAYGGFVEITQEQLPEQLVAGEWHQSERTIVVISSLLGLLRRRDRQSWIPDLETCLLLDAVATKVGLIQKRY